MLLLLTAAFYLSLYYLLPSVALTALLLAIKKVTNNYFAMKETTPFRFGFGWPYYLARFSCEVIVAAVRERKDLAAPATKETR